MRPTTVISHAMLSSLLVLPLASFAQTASNQGTSAYRAVAAAGGGATTTIGGARGAGGFSGATVHTSPAPAVATSVLGGGSGTQRSAATTGTANTTGTTGTTGTTQ
ncbi:MAG: hypothetical protein ACRYHA_26900 [Janthinobacterium lividum]